MKGLVERGGGAGVLRGVPNVIVQAFQRVDLGFARVFRGHLGGGAL